MFRRNNINNPQDSDGEPKVWRRLSDSAVFAKNPLPLSADDKILGLDDDRLGALRAAAREALDVEPPPFDDIISEALARIGDDEPPPTTSAATPPGHSENGHGGRRRGAGRKSRKPTSTPWHGTFESIASRTAELATQKGAFERAKERAAIEWSKRLLAKGPERITPHENHLLLRLLAAVNRQHGCAWPSRNTLACEIGITQAGLTKALAQLRDAGLVVIDDRRGKRMKDGERLTNRYALPCLIRSDSDCNHNQDLHPEDCNHNQDYGPPNCNGNQVLGASDCNHNQVKTATFSSFQVSAQTPASRGLAAEKTPISGITILDIDTREDSSLRSESKEARKTEVETEAGLQGDPIEPDEIVPPKASPTSHPAKPKTPQRKPKQSALALIEPDKPPSSPDELPDERKTQFLEFWSSYPRPSQRGRKNRRYTIPAWLEIVDGENPVEPELLIQAAKAYAAEVQTREANGDEKARDFVANSATWLRERRFEPYVDVLDEEPQIDAAKIQSRSARPTAKASQSRHAPTIDEHVAAAVERGASQKVCNALGRTLLNMKGAKVPDPVQFLVDVSDALNEFDDDALSWARREISKHADWRPDNSLVLKNLKKYQHCKAEHAKREKLRELDAPQLLVSAHVGPKLEALAVSDPSEWGESNGVLFSDQFHRWRWGRDRETEKESAAKRYALKLDLFADREKLKKLGIPDDLKIDTGRPWGTDEKNRLIRHLRDEAYSELRRISNSYGGDREWQRTVESAGLSDLVGDYDRFCDLEKESQGKPSTLATRIHHLQIKWGDES